MEYKSHLIRFYDGQRFVYEYALEEIKAGKKQEHWIWCVFPQLKGIGTGPVAVHYGIDSLDEARAYLKDEILNSHLREITSALLEHKGMAIEDIMGETDALKLRSSMTLFDLVSPGDIYAQVLEAFFEGKKCELTKSLLAP